MSDSTKQPYHPLLNPCPPERIEWMKRRQYEIWLAAKNEVPPGFMVSIEVSGVAGSVGTMKIEYRFMCTFDLDPDIPDGVHATAAHDAASTIAMAIKNWKIPDGY